MAKYKSWEFYCCLVLNRLAAEVDIDIYQPGIEEKLDIILSSGDYSVSKLELSKEIKSNHLMTEKVLKHLENEGLIRIELREKSYAISITKKGILFARRYNEFYISQYKTLIEEHYKYRPLPSWFARGGSWQH
ncbi:MAG: hypothetical protein QW728_07910 [Thermoplasmata archaeon]